MLAIDGALLREQRSYVDKLLVAARGRERLDEASTIEGLQNLLDAIADQAFDNHGIDGLLHGHETAMTGFYARANVPDAIVREVLAELVVAEIDAIKEQPDVMLAQLAARLTPTEIRERLLRKMPPPCNDPSSSVPPTSSTPTPPPTSETSPPTDA